MTPETPIWQLTVGEFKQLIREAQPTPQQQPAPKNNELVEGLEGLARLLKCGKTKAQQISRSGIIEEATFRSGRLLRYDPEKVLRLLQAANSNHKPNLITKKRQPC